MQSNKVRFVSPYHASQRGLKGRLQRESRPYLIGGGLFIMIVLYYIFIDFSFHHSAEQQAQSNKNMVKLVHTQSTTSKVYAGEACVIPVGNWDHTCVSGKSTIEGPCEVPGKGPRCLLKASCKDIKDEDRPATYEYEAGTTPMLMNLNGQICSVTDPNSCGTNHIYSYCSVERVVPSLPVAVPPPEQAFLVPPFPDVDYYDDGPKPKKKRHVREEFDGPDADLLDDDEFEIYRPVKEKHQRRERDWDRKEHREERIHDNEWAGDLDHGEEIQIDPFDKPKRDGSYRERREQEEDREMLRRERDRERDREHDRDQYRDRERDHDRDRDRDYRDHDTEREREHKDHHRDHGLNRGRRGDDDFLEEERVRGGDRGRGRDRRARLRGNDEDEDEA